MTYHLDIDPQPTVVAQMFHVDVMWPSGFSPTGPLPTGWKATRQGARFDGPVTQTTAWEIPLSKS
jgi:hypothetical protein